MRTITGRIEIDRPIEEVFDFVADETNEPSYNDDMVRCVNVTPGPIGMGTRYEAELKSTGSAVMTVEVTGYERPHLLNSTARIPDVMDIRGAVTFEPLDDHTLMSWQWEVTPYGWMRLLGPLVSFMGRRNEERIWTSLKTHLERRNGSVLTTT